MYKSFVMLFITSAVSVSALSIDTPGKLTQCDTVTLNWDGAKSPFVLFVLPSCESDVQEPLAEFPPMNATTYQWTVNIPLTSGPVSFAITDVEGNEAFTDEVEIRDSGNAGCLNAAQPSPSIASTTFTTSTTSASPAVATVAVAAAPIGPGVAPGPGAAPAGSGVTPAAPVNAGSTNKEAGSGGVVNAANGAIANTVSVIAGIISFGTGLVALF